VGRHLNREEDTLLRQSICEKFMKHFVAMLLIGFSAAFVSRVLVAEPPRPNVILLLVDDMG
jgi:hypothetical protein